MNFLFLIDEPHKVNIKKDTSFALMLSAHKKGHKIYCVEDGDIISRDGEVYFKAVLVEPQKVNDKPFIEKGSEELCGDKIDAVFVRNDPPFDEQYLINTWLLDRLNEKTVVINRPSGIRTVNEKIWATQFKSIIPKTLITRKIEELQGFLNDEKEIIVKPTGSYGGSSVFYIRFKDTNANVIFETITQNESKEIIAQKYIPESKNGDKRILLLEGKALGAVLRVHAKGEHRNNFFSGGKPIGCDITARDKEIIAVLRPKLKELGLYFVGIDIIGDYLIEVNVTSPTCLQEMNSLYEEHLEDEVIGFAEELIKKHKKRK